MPNPQKPVKQTPASNQIKAAEIKPWAISKLKPAEYNPRKITEKMYKKLRESIEQNGDLGVLVVNTHPARFGVIVGGNQRLRIFKDMKLQTVMCREVHIDLKAEKLLNVKLNKVGGIWDDDILANEYEISDLMEAGFEEYELLGEKHKVGKNGDEGEADQATGSVIQYAIIFNNEAEQSRWFQFLKDLKEQYPDMPTISERIIAYLQENS